MKRAILALAIVAGAVGVLATSVEAQPKHFVFRSPGTDCTGKFLLFPTVAGLLSPFAEGAVATSITTPLYCPIATHSDATPFSDRPVSAARVVYATAGQETVTCTLTAARTMTSGGSPTGLTSNIWIYPTSPSPSPGTGGLANDRFAEIDFSGGPGMSIGGSELERASFVCLLPGSGPFISAVIKGYELQYDQ